jgi:hypothetical protein
MADPHLKQWEDLAGRIPHLKNNTDLSDKDFEGCLKERFSHVLDLIDNEKVQVQ